MTRRDLTVMYARGDDPRLFVSDRHWGYQAIWDNGKVPVAINTRLEKVANRYWGKLLKEGRGIVPAGGWYEWTGKKGNKQPWHIHRKDRAPLYFAALVWFGEAHDGDLDAPSAGFLSSPQAPKAEWLIHMTGARLFSLPKMRHYGSILTFRQNRRKDSTFGLGP